MFLVSTKQTRPSPVSIDRDDFLFAGSPFTVNVGGHGSNRLRESITRERRAVDITHIGSQCELSLKIPGTLFDHAMVHCHLYLSLLGTSAYDMSAYVTSPSGRLENCEIV
jgi:filamin